MLTETVIRRDLEDQFCINNCRSLLLLEVLTDTLVQQNVSEPRIGCPASGFEHRYVDTGEQWIPEAGNSPRWELLSVPFWYLNHLFQLRLWCFYTRLHCTAMKWYHCTTLLQ